MSTEFFAIGIVRVIGVGHVETNAFLQIIRLPYVEFPTISTLDNIYDVSTVAVERTCVLPPTLFPEVE
jgi:hypothetical protein